MCRMLLVLAVSENIMGLFSNFDHVRFHPTLREDAQCMQVRTWAPGTGSPTRAEGSGSAGIWPECPVLIPSSHARRAWQPSMCLAQATSHVPGHHITTHTHRTTTDHIPLYHATLCVWLLLSSPPGGFYHPPNAEADWLLFLSLWGCLTPWVLWAHMCWVWVQSVC